MFRALNIDDQKEINNGVTSENGEVKKVFTNKQKYPENNKYEHKTEKLKTKYTCKFLQISVKYQYIVNNDKRIKYMQK